MYVKDLELQKLNFEKQALIRQFDQNFISEETYNERFENLEKRINEKVRLIIESERNKIKEEQKNQEVEKKMSEEEQPKKIGKKVQKNSNASAIAEVLMKKSVKNVDQAVTAFDEIKPGNDPAKTKSQIKTIIREAKKGKGRWAHYTWDDEEFQLTPKE